jgi:hypothetical protein
MGFKIRKRKGGEREQRPSQAEPDRIRKRWQQQGPSCNLDEFGDPIPPRYRLDYEIQDESGFWRRIPNAEAERLLADGRAILVVASEVKKPARAQAGKRRIRKRWQQQGPSCNLDEFGDPIPPRYRLDYEIQDEWGFWRRIPNAEAERLLEQGLAIFDE